MKHVAALLAALAVPAIAQEEPEGAPSPGEIVAAAPASDWIRIMPEDLLVMTLAPDAKGNAREVVIQLMPPPFSQGWIDNIRTLARAHWYDGIAVVRVQDNYVVQWGDPNNDNPEGTGPAKPLPEGLKVMGENEYEVPVDQLAESPAYGGLEEAESENELSIADQKKIEKLFSIVSDPTKTEKEHEAALRSALSIMGLGSVETMSPAEQRRMLSISSTQTSRAPEGWHERDSFADWVEIWNGWPIANREKSYWTDENGKRVEDPLLTRHEARQKGLFKETEDSFFWPVHCYASVGVGRSYSPDTGTGAELYTVIGHAPRHLDRNIAVVGRVISGIELLSSLPRGTGDLGFYETEAERIPIVSVRVASDLPAAERPAFEYLNDRTETFEKYADARANRRDPFFIHPAGGADICNIPVPVRRVDESG